MRSWVIDTNVIVAAHLSPHGYPARLLLEVYERRLRMAYDARIADEYRAVLLRPKFGLQEAAVLRFMAVLNDQDLVSPVACVTDLPDEDDRVFLEVALTTDEKVLVTGNTRHFPEESCEGVTVLTPAEAWMILAS